MKELAPIVAFAGPSLPRARAIEILGPSGIVLPPASAGDLIRALRLRPRALVLLDGRFDDVPSPWHKELLLALELGIHVFGGASMGALRAVECEPFGVVPVGRIADSYRSGRREDDAVAISHLPEAGGWRPVSTALVDLEAMVESSTRDGTISAERGSELIREARETPFPRRSRPEEIGKIEQTPGLKEQDAVLTCVKAAETEGRRPPGIRVPRTTWLLRLARFALGSPFPPCPELPDHERRFTAAVKADPWIAPLFFDAITFESVRVGDTPRSRLSRERRDALHDHHLARIPGDHPRPLTGTNLINRITDRQIEILEAIDGLELGNGRDGLIDQNQGSGARDDALTRISRSESIPPIRDALLESDPERLAGNIKRHLG